MRACLSSNATTWAVAAAIVMAAIVLVPPNAWAQGGPPLITDDPDTPGPGHWEINLATIVEKSRPERRSEAPLADINYGIGTRIQLKFEIPWVTMVSPDQSAQTGIGNNNTGVKWRFLGREGEPVSWSIYPQLEMNTRESSAVKGLVERQTRLFLPTEFTVQKGRVEINGEVGRMFVHDGEDGWAAGVTTEIEISRALELLGEFHAEKDGESPTDEIVNIGVRKAISEKIWFLGSIGTGVSGDSDARVHLRVYAGIQLNLPKQYHADTPAVAK